MTRYEHITQEELKAQHWGMHDAARKRLLRSCDHEWVYMERQPGETYTGYCERCRKCGDIQQIVQ